jgi:hypothetical protein
MERETFRVFLYFINAAFFHPLWQGVSQDDNPFPPTSAVAGHAQLRRPPRSPDLMPCDLLLWGYVKDSVVLATLPNDLLQLCGRIIAAISEIVRDMLQRMWAEMDYRLDVCLVTKDRPVEDLWGMREKRNLGDFLFLSVSRMLQYFPPFQVCRFCGNGRNTRYGSDFIKQYQICLFIKEVLIVGTEGF